MQDAGISLAEPMPPLDTRSWFEPPVVIHARLAPMNLIQVGAFTGIYGGRLGHCSIGRYCSIAPGVDVASDQHPIDWLSTSMVQYVDNIHGWGNWIGNQGGAYVPPREGFDSNAVVHIGNDVWVGQGVFIKSGVRIGDGAVIAAHAVIVHDVPAYAIVAGVPARVVRYRFAPDVIARLAELRWWDYQVLTVKDLKWSDPQAAIGRLEALKSAGELTPFPGTRIHPAKGS